MEPSGLAGLANNVTAKQRPHSWQIPQRLTRGQSSGWITSFSGKSIRTYKAVTAQRGPPVPQREEPPWGSPYSRGYRGPQRHNVCEHGSHTHHSLGRAESVLFPKGRKIWILTSRTGSQGLCDTAGLWLKKEGLLGGCTRSLDWLEKKEIRFQSNH